MAASTPVSTRPTATGGSPLTIPTCRTSPSVRDGQPAAADVHRGEARLRAGGCGLLPDRTAHAGPYHRRHAHAGGVPSGADIHRSTAAKIFHVPPEDVTPGPAFRAKAINFGIVYGKAAFSLSQDIGVTVAEAKAYMERYFCRPIRACANIDGYMEWPLRMPVRLCFHPDSAAAAPCWS